MESIGIGSASSQQQILTEQNDAQEKLQTFWQKQMDEITIMTNNEFKTQDLPLARIKKIMKMDEDVKMISAEAPLLFSKAAQMFITELSLRAWIHTEESKRRTLQRNDIATAITKFDQFDFLIDIVPREELKTPPKRAFGTTGGSGDAPQFFYSVPQGQAANNAAGTTAAASASNSSSTVAQTSVQASALQSGQLLLAQQNQNGQPMTLTPVNMDNSQVLQLAQQTLLTQPAQSQQSQQASTILLSPTSVNDNNQNQMQKQQQQITEQSLRQTLQQQHNKALSQPQSAQQILQQLVSNLPNSAAGGVHTIQMNAQGQLQLVKVPDQTQTQDSTGTEGSRQSTATDNSQIFNISSNMNEGSQQTTLYVNPED